MRFDLPDALLAQLRARFTRPRDPTEVREDAFLLDPGLGPCCYLTSDGRVLVDGTDWDDTPLREATDAEAISTIVVGAEKSGIRELLSLLPRRPDSAHSCVRCDGTGRDPFGPVCGQCHGLGWT